MQCLHNFDAGIEIISIPATKVAVEGDTPHLPPREVEFASYCEPTLIPRPSPDTNNSLLIYQYSLTSHHY